MDIHDSGSTRRPLPVTIRDAAAPRQAGLGFSGRETGDLRAALAILAEQMHEAAARRRMSPPGTETFRRADERIAYLTALFRQLQNRMTIPEEVWSLGLQTSS